MKKLLALVILVTLLCGNIIKVDAKDYFVNNNGVKLSKEEYDAISEFYWEGYQNDMHLDDYNFLNENGLFDSAITSVQTYDNDSSGISLFAEHTTRAKSLKMSKACNTSCIISVSLKWLRSPNVRSYDLIGEYLDGTTIINRGKVIVSNETASTTYDPDKYSSTTIGTSFKLPDTGDAIRIAHTFSVKQKGTINASYQHAKKSISLANSKKYSFSRSGIGGVFKFEPGIQDYYDCMLGVSLNLN